MLLYKENAIGLFKPKTVNHRIQTLNKRLVHDRKLNPLLKSIEVQQCINFENVISQVDYLFLKRQAKQEEIPESNYRRTSDNVDQISPLVAYLPQLLNAIVSCIACICSLMRAAEYLSSWCIILWVVATEW